MGGAAYALSSHGPGPGGLPGRPGGVAAAQEPDISPLHGTHHQPRKHPCVREQAGGDWSQSSHELYNLGHLYARRPWPTTARHRRRDLLDVALKSADLLDRTGPGKGLDMARRRHQKWAW